MRHNAHYTEKIPQMSISDLELAVPNPFDKIRDSWAPIALSAIDEESLTDEQRFAICVAAGIPIEMDNLVDGKITMRTKNPCAVVKIDGRWQVFTQERE